MCVTPVSGSTSCGRAGGQQRRRQPQRVRRHHVVVGEAVDEQQRPGQAAGERQQRRSLVGLGVLVREPEVALGVGGVVERPVGAGRPGDGGVEDVGPPQDRQCGEVAAERPAADRHPRRGPAPRARRRRRSSAVDLVVEHRVGEVDGAPPVPTTGCAAGCRGRRPRRRRSPARRTTATRCARTCEASTRWRVRAAVRVHEHRQRAVARAATTREAAAPRGCPRAPAVSSAGRARISGSSASEAIRANSAPPRSTRTTAPGCLGVEDDSTAVRPPLRAVCRPGSAVSGVTPPSGDEHHVPLGRLGRADDEDVVLARREPPRAPGSRPASAALTVGAAACSVSSDHLDGEQAPVGRPAGDAGHDVDPAGVGLLGDDAGRPRRRRPRAPAAPRWSTGQHLHERASPSDCPRHAGEVRERPSRSQATSGAVAVRRRPATATPSAFGGARGGVAVLARPCRSGCTGSAIHHSCTGDSSTRSTSSGVGVRRPPEPAAAVELLGGDEVGEPAGDVRRRRARRGPGLRAVARRRRRSAAAGRRRRRSAPSGESRGSTTGPGDGELADRRAERQVGGEQAAGQGERRHVSRPGRWRTRRCRRRPRASARVGPAPRRTAPRRRRASRTRGSATSRSAPGGHVQRPTAARRRRSRPLDRTNTTRRTVGGDGEAARRAER